MQFVSCPRVARSYFLCDSISAAGTLTQDSLLLLPSHNTSCIFRELPRPKGIGDSLYRFISKIKKNRKLTDSYRRTANFPPFGFFTFNISLTIDRVCSRVVSLRVLPLFSMHIVFHNTPCIFRVRFISKIKKREKVKMIGCVTYFPLQGLNLSVFSSDRFNVSFV